jgi:hypothetical protein
MHRTTNFFGEIKMKKDKKFKLGILIIELVFTLLYFPIWFGAINISINNKPIGNREITPILSDGKSVLLKWYCTWGGEDRDRGYGVAVDSSGNVYLVGTTLSFGAGGWDIVLIKYDGNGMQQWNRTWGGGNWDYGYGVTVDSSENVYLAGGTESFGVGGLDMVLVKYDGNGVQQWNRTWGGGDHDCGNRVVLDSSENIYLTGVTASFGAGYSDMIMVKYYGNGTQQWNCTWGGDDNDYSNGMAVDSSDNVYLAGGTESFGAGVDDMVLIKYDGNGVQQWNRTWGGEDTDGGYGITVDSSGDVYFAGRTDSFGVGGSDMVLVKYDGNGIQQWNRTWGGGEYDCGTEVALDSLDNVYLAGSTESFGVGGHDMVLVKYDGNGTQQWNCTWGGDDNDYSNGITVDSSDNIYLAGDTFSFGAGDFDMVLVKYSYTERLPSDGFIMILIIVVSIASLVGVGIAITYVVRKRKKVVE